MCVCVCVVGGGKVGYIYILGCFHTRCLSHKSLMNFSVSEIKAEAGQVPYFQLWLTGVAVEMRTAISVHTTPVLILT